MPSIAEVIQKNDHLYRKKQLQKWDAQIPGAVKGYLLKDHLYTCWDGRIPKYAVDTIVDYVKEPKKFLILIGSSGVGKTAMGVSLARYLIASGYANSGFYYTASDLLHNLSFARDDDDRSLQKAHSSPVLLLDDVGALSSTANMTETRRAGVWNLINSRWSHENRHTIITTNLPISTSQEGTTSLREWFGTSAWDRIADDCSIVQFSGHSFRGKGRI